jgi:hypothetical protein
MSLPSERSPEPLARTARAGARRLLRRALVVASLLAVVAVMLTVGVGASALSARQCFPPDRTRHGLAGDVPWPGSVALQTTDSGAYREPEGDGTQATWIFSVPPRAWTRSPPST